VKYDLIYVDTSVLLAQLLSEDIHPPTEFWDHPLVSSRLIEYETWTRVHALNVEKSHGVSARTLLGRISMLELTPLVLSRALEPFPTPLRTLDALHLASLSYLHSQKIRVAFAAYDQKLIYAAGMLRFGLADGFSNG